jgi:hypothetical protein
MKPSGPKGEVQALRRFIERIEKHFLTSHLSSVALGPPKQQEVLDVAAYAVLAHGALENFVEGLGLWTLERLERTWIHRRRATGSTASILLYRDAPPLSLDMTPGVLVFDNVRTALQGAKSETSKRIEQNQGISLRHLRALFRPLGIDVPEDPLLAASLDSLVSLRHQWAHQYRFGAKVIKSAKDVQKIVGDCLVLADKLANGAVAARP